MLNDFKDASGRWVAHQTIAGKRIRTRSCMKWWGMRSRCKVGGSEQQKHHTYIGCTLSPLFSDFQTFTDWYVEQIGYVEVEYEVDKDLLFKGNKEYSESFCVLVPQQLNKFLLSHTASCGDYPQGVHFHNQTSKFRAQIRIGGISTHLGLYFTPEEARQAYKVAKQAEAYRWYERLKSGEFTVDPRVVERMKTWTFENN